MLRYSGHCTNIWVRKIPPLERISFTDCSLANLGRRNFTLCIFVNIFQSTNFKFPTCIYDIAATTLYFSFVRKLATLGLEEISSCLFSFFSIVEKNSTLDHFTFHCQASVSAALSKMIIIRQGITSLPFIFVEFAKNLRFVSYKH